MADQEYFELTDSSEAPLRDYQSGDRALVVNGNGVAMVDMDSAQVAMDAKVEELRAWIAGRQTYETLALAQAAGEPASGETVVVWNDPDISLNGEYGWDGSQLVMSAFSILSGEKLNRELLDGRVTFGSSDDLKSGTNIGGAGYVFATPVPEKLIMMNLSYWGQKAYTGRLMALEQLSEGVFTVLREYPFEISVGFNEIGFSELPDFYLETGEYFGVYAPAAIAVTNSEDADNGGLWSGTYGSTITDSNGTISTSPRIEIAAVFGRHVRSSDNIDLLRRFLRSGVLENTFAIGKTLEPTDGSVNGDRTWILAAPSSASGIVEQCQVYSKITGNLYVKKFSKSGDDFTQIGDELPVSIAAGLNNIDLSDYQYTVNTGEYLGFWAEPGCLVNTSDGESSLIGYYDNGNNGDVAALTDATVSYGVSLQIGFTCRRADAGALALTQADAISSGQRKSKIPEQFFLCWLIGQSNTAGRATEHSREAVPVGSGFKYVRDTNSLEHLSDPTGNDSASAGSMGPALANEIIDQSDGGVGVVIVNSAQGGTSLLTHWADGGNYWTQAVADLAAAVALSEASGIRLAGVSVVMAQGETDGDNDVSASEYKAAFRDLHSRIKTTIGTKVPFVIARTGQIKNGDTAGYATIRAAQNELAATDDGVYMGHSAAIDFAARGLMMDSFHYKRRAYDEVGHALGKVAWLRGCGIIPISYSA